MDGVLIMRDENKTKEQLINEECYYALFNNSIDAILLTEPNGVIYAANPEACHIFGWTEEELCKIGRNGVVDITDTRLQLALDERNHTGKFKGELAFIRKDGAKFLGEVSSAVFKDKDGLYKTSMIIRDTTERNLMEEKLITTEKSYSSIFENTMVGIYQSSPQGYYITVNPAFAHIFGYDSPQELMSLVEAPQLYVNVEDRDKCIQQVLEHGVSNFDVQVYRKDRSMAWISNNVRVVRDKNGNIVCFEGIVKDITQSKQAQEELNRYRKHLEKLVEERTVELIEANEQLQLEIAERKQTEEKLLNQFRQMCTIFDSINALVYVADMETYDLLFINKYGVDIYGEGVVGKQCFKVLQASQYKPCPFCTNHLLICDGIPQLPYSWEFKSTKSNRWFHCIDRAITWIDGRLVRLEIAFDNTERKQMEEFLLYLASIVENSDSAIFSTDLNGIITTWNPSAQKYYGYTSEEIKGHAISILFPHEISCEFSKILTKINQGEYIAQYETLRLRKDGTRVNVSINMSPIKDANGKVIGVSSIHEDISKRKHMEKEMDRLGRLNLIGEMSAGIAHEIRNPMTTVRGFLQMLGGKKEYSQIKEYFNLMIEELDRANSIITEFLSLAKNKPIDLKIQNLNDIIKNISPLIAADSIISDKYLELELSEVPGLLLDESEIRQLILNLVRNGLDAISSGEYLTIKTYFDGSEVILVVKDCGKGIPSDILDKIGTPFFTTKENGTGLGLATCYSIANRHNASIKIDSGPEGTTFYVRFRVST